MHLLHGGIGIHLLVYPTHIPLKLTHTPPPGKYSLAILPADDNSQKIVLYLKSRKKEH